MDAFVADRIRLIVEFYEIESQKIVNKNEIEIESLKSEVTRLSEENTALKQELDAILHHADQSNHSAVVQPDKPTRAKLSPSKTSRNSNKSPEELENSEPHANALPVPKRSRVQPAAKTSIPNPRSTRTRSKNT